MGLLGGRLVHASLGGESISAAGVCSYPRTSMKRIDRAWRDSSVTTTGGRNQVSTRHFRIYESSLGSIRGSSRFSLKGALMLSMRPPTPLNWGHVRAGETDPVSLAPGTPGGHRVDGTG